MPPAGDSRPTDAPEPGDDSGARPAVPPPPPPQEAPAPPPPPGPPSAPHPPERAPAVAIPAEAPSEAPAPPPPPAEPGPDQTQEITPATSAPPTPLWTPPPWTGPQSPTVPPAATDWATAQPAPPVGGPQWGPAVPPYPAFPAPKRRRRGLWITAIVLAGVLLLCGGGGIAGYLVLRDVETGEGAAEPVAAVESFLDAVYVKQNATAAAALVCGDARDVGALQDKVDEIQRYARTYPNPRYKWDPPKVEQQDAEKALVSTRLTVLTADDRSTAEQLRFTVVHTTGWWVCDVG
ncbi:hypothetical protein DFJ67_2544 [Asanoa ferruginea]|uniref:Ig-like domain-containing protein n=1 Tax=Asanoa ferruginea TaxID=53367 RepID=A0A3D9ZGM6_9ACTN|nr:hypothetical protein DFJ67_2544 [Asanoa ferruginea]